MLFRSLCPPPGGLSECIVHDGDVPCVDPFVNRHLVGDDFALGCSACSCSVSGVCKATVTFSSQQTCAVEATVTVDNACDVPSPTGGSYSYYAYQPNLASASCAITAKATPNITLVGPRTVCCR